jgi:tRNA dimethylallyltransferase
MDAEGPDALRDEVLSRAPGSEIARGDRSRIVRYLELLEMGEDPYPILEGSDPARGGTSQLWTEQTRVPTALVGLVMDRDVLDARIDERMATIGAAAVDEVRAADAAGASPTARKALGFEELLAGDVEAMKHKARRLARRQLTWMHKLPGVNVLDTTGREPSELAEQVAKFLEE